MSKSAEKCKTSKKKMQKIVSSFSSQSEEDFSYINSDYMISEEDMECHSD